MEVGQQWWKWGDERESSRKEGQGRSRRHNRELFQRVKETHMAEIQQILRQGLEWLSRNLFL